MLLLLNLKKIENAEIPNDNAETPINSPEFTCNTDDECDDIYVVLDDALVKEICRPSEDWGVQSPLSTGLAR